MNTQNLEKSSQRTSSDELSLSSRAVSSIVAFAIILCAGIFIAGYFYGKKDTIDHLMQNHEQQFLGDHVYASLCQLYNQPESDNNEMVATNINDTPAADDSNTITKIEEPVVIPEPSTTSVLVANSVEPQKTESEIQYFAQLVGFGTQKMAQQCADRLLAQGLPVLVKKRYSVNAKKKKKIWYQLVTHPHANRQELDQLVDRITKVEKLKDVCIVTS